MKFLSQFKRLTKFELVLWLVSVAVVTASFLLTYSGNLLSLIASVIGVTALIFVAKGMVIGQVLSVVFAAFYGIISLYFRYYGEVITYLGMTAPIAVMSVVSWIKNPYKDEKEVKVNVMGKKQVAIMLALSIIVTGAFYFILKALGNASLFFSTLSVTTSFLASYLTFMRSPYYALAYAANDVVLITLWIIAAVQESGYTPMVMCFVMFLVNDLYGFINWQKMKKRQLLNN